MFAIHTKIILSHIVFSNTNTKKRTKQKNCIHCQLEKKKSKVRPMLTIAIYVQSIEQNALSIATKHC